MDMKGEYRVAAPRERVWEALNDPEVLKVCIPGCESLEKTSPTTFVAKVTAAVGPVKARFTGNVTLSDLVPPESYVISGEGKGGAAGFAKGSAKVNLAAESPTMTLLAYEVSANVGGKLAQLGARLIDGTAKKMADEFFRRFSERVAEPVGAEEAPAVAEAPQPQAAEAAPADTGPMPPEREVAVEPAVPFPPAQPDVDAAAASATAGRGEGTKQATGTPASRWPASGGLSPVTWIIGLAILILLLVILAL